MRPIVKLYFSSGTCSLVPHIVLREAKVPIELVRVDLRTHQTEHGVDYYGINPKGSVPALELDNGERITEVPVIAQYVADTAHNVDLMPAAGTITRYRVMEWLNYISSELHKAYSPLFNASFDEAARALYRTALRKKYEYINKELEGREYLTGKPFTAADAYLFTVTRWAKHAQVDMSGFDNVKAFMDRVNQRPTVREAITAESNKKA